MQSRMESGQCLKQPENQLSEADFVSALFDKGNYTAVVGAGREDCLQTYAALGLIGRTDSALDGLGRFDSDTARFYSAVAMWMDGDEGAAIRTLEKLHFPHADKLLALIKKPQINVLGQMDTGGWWDLASVAKADGKFHIENIGFNAGDKRNSPYANIHQFYDPSNPPDFFLSKMAEWHLVIPNLRELPCPTFAHTGDYDLHLHAFYPWLRIFDELIVDKDWDDIHDLASIPVSTFPKAYGLPPSLPLPPINQREIDVFASGNINHSYHPDKAAVTYRVLGMDGINSLSIGGFMGMDQYLRQLGNSKMVVSFTRRPAMPTRGLEALAMGAVAIVQTDSAMLHYFGENEGVVAVAGEHELEQTIRNIVHHWPMYEQRARRGSEIVRREFDRARVALQYFRFLTFLASKPRARREVIEFNRTIQKRSIFMKGWVYHPSVYQEIRDQNFARCAELFKQEAEPRHLIDMARECVLEYATWQQPASAQFYARLQNGPSVPEAGLLEAATKIYMLGLKSTPLSLVLRFNYIRMVLHFGQPDEVDEALRLALDTLAQPLEAWQIDPMEDIFPYDFLGDYFNYRAYFDGLVSTKQGRSATGTGNLAKLIVASINYYVSGYILTGEFALNAVKHDPDFPFYKLNAAIQLIDRGQANDIKTVRQLLLQLTNNTMLCLQASMILDLLIQRGDFAIDEELSAVIAKMHRISDSVKMLAADNGAHDDVTMLMPANRGVGQGL